MQQSYFYFQTAYEPKENIFLMHVIVFYEYALSKNE